MINRDYCAACGSKKVRKILDFGAIPNSNELVSKENLKRIKRWKIKFYWCEDCSLFQQLNLVSETTLFKNNYAYQTSINTPSVEHFRSLAKELKDNTRTADFAVVIGSNDGTELRLLKEAGFSKVLGIEPAKNMAKIANDSGLNTINNFFTEELSRSISDNYGKADFVIANNVFAHIPYPEDMLLGMKNLIKPDGQIVIEVQWFKDVFQKLAIETLYAEHYYEWTVKAMVALARRCSLKLVKATPLPNIQGGSIQFKFKLDGIEDSVLQSEEQKVGLYDINKLIKLRSRIEFRKRKLVELLKRLKKANKKIVIWTVPAKVPTLLNLFKIGSKFIDCAYDSTPLKINKFIPDANIPIKDEALLNKDMKDRPDYIIIGAWNYLDFAKKKLKWFTDENGKLINLLTGELIKD